MYEKTGDVRKLRGGTGFNSLPHRLCGSIYPDKGRSLC